MRSILTILFFSITTLTFAQIHFTGSAKMLLHGGAKVLVTNPQSNGITFTSGSGIVMYDESAEVILNIGNSVGTYTIPFITPDNITVPFTYDVTTPGVGGGRISFSSYRTDAINNPRPVEVIQMDDPFYAINRFWIIRPLNYTVKPIGTYIFTYDVNELVGTGITESNLTAQRYNNDDDLWLDWLYAPTANLANKTVTLTVANIEDQYPVWTLTDQAFPLPIRLLRFTMDCETGTINWSTATETDNDRFVIEASDDAYDWVAIDSVNGAGNSIFPSYYSYNSSEYSYLYWRLVWVSSYDVRENGPIIISCYKLPQAAISVRPNPTSGGLMIIGGDGRLFTIMDASGKIIRRGLILDGGIDISDVASGIYVLSVHDSGSTVKFKIIKI